MKFPKPGSETAGRFEGLLPSDPRVVRKLVFGHPAAFVQGQMFCGTFGDQIFVRLAEEDRAVALRLPGAKPFEPMKGRPMTEYVVLPAPVLDDPKRAHEWFRRSFDWALTLPPKAGPSARRVRSASAAPRARSRKRP